VPGTCLAPWCDGRASDLCERPQRGFPELCVRIAGGGEHAIHVACVGVPRFTDRTEDVVLDRRRSSFGSQIGKRVLHFDLARVTE
jgi:hypothetical protein